MAKLNAIDGVRKEDVSGFTVALRVAWTLLSVAIAGYFIGAYDETTNRDAAIVLAYALMTLGFPLSFIATFVIAGIAMFADKLLGIKILADGRLGMVEASLLLIAAGYVQWFVLLPAGWNAVRKHLSMHTR